MSESGGKHVGFPPLEAPSSGVSEKEGIEHARRALVDLIPRQARRTLDPACGSGRTAALIREAIPQCSITAVEPDAAAASLARAYCDELHVGIDAKFRYAPRSADAVPLFDALEHLAELLALFPAAGYEITQMQLIEDTTVGLLTSATEESTGVFRWGRLLVGPLSVEELEKFGARHVLVVARRTAPGTKEKDCSFIVPTVADQEPDQRLLDALRAVSSATHETVLVVSESESEEFPPDLDTAGVAGLRKVEFSRLFKERPGGPRTHGGEVGDPQPLVYKSKVGKADLTECASRFLMVPLLVEIRAVVSHPSVRAVTVLPLGRHAVAWLEAEDNWKCRIRRSCGRGRHSY